MTARIKNPANLLPDSMTGIQSIIKAAHSAGVPRSTRELAHLRASQINGCSPCEAAKHFDGNQLARLVLWVATTNLFNRINAATKQPAGAPSGNGHNRQPHLKGRK